MPPLAVAKQRVGKEIGSRALVADSKGDMGLLLPSTNRVARDWRVRSRRLVVG